MNKLSNYFRYIVNCCLRNCHYTLVTPADIEQNKTVFCCICGIKIEIRKIDDDWYEERYDS